MLIYISKFVDDLISNESSTVKLLRIWQDQFKTWGDFWNFSIENILRLTYWNGRLFNLLTLYWKSPYHPTPNLRTYKQEWWIKGLFDCLWISLVLRVGLRVCLWYEVTTNTRNNEFQYGLIEVTITVTSRNRSKGSGMYGRYTFTVVLNRECGRRKDSTSEHKSWTINYRGKSLE